MMKSVIICEGNTDVALIQYFLEKVYGWEHIPRINHASYEGVDVHKIDDTKKVEWFRHHNGNFLCMISAGGVSKIPSVLKKIVDLNHIGSINPFERIAIVSDRDEVETELQFLLQLSEVFMQYNVSFGGDLKHNYWNSTTYTNEFLDILSVEFIPLIIPFEETGAIEHFLLQALCDESQRCDPLTIDKQVIEQCISFIDRIDCQNKYLKHRREITKAKFNTVFNVMTPNEAFGQRRSLLRSVPWEKYEAIQNGFKQFSLLSEKK